MVKVSRVVLIVLMSLLLSLVLVACSGPETPAWLLGRWQVAYNPGQDDNDALLFQQGSKVRIETEDGRVLEGRYQIEQDQLVMYVELRRRSVEIRVRISTAKDRLIFSSGAYYMKTENSQAGDNPEDDARQ